ncbi:hypothetical protein LCGC14_1832300 [marine sediment metagenome]|uniref:Uncharacterized protein n=1 Tax=marine sediment metagenome TaxID=412755 RepID=A0A0F9IV78_9ZZZZ
MIRHRYPRARCEICGKTVSAHHPQLGDFNTLRVRRHKRALRASDPFQSTPWCKGRYGKRESSE